LLYRGWGYAGYKIGDKMCLIGGSSLDIGKKSDFKRILDEYLRNIRKFSSFDFDEKNLTKYGKIMETFRPKYLYGYASSIYFFSKWLEIDGISINPLLGVLTTAENLFPHMRRNIESVFRCKVFNAYGLNDGGVSAFECGEHIGLHIDTERSIMEVVDDYGQAIEQGEGQIVATSLFNYAMPFIRYNTGDEGVLLDETCPCGRGYPLLKKVLGRQQEILVTPEGKHIHGEYISHIFWGISHIREFQVVQKKIDQLTFYIVPEDGFDEKSLDYIRSVISSRSKGWNLDFRFVDKIDRTRGGKYKFIINEVVHV
jgi:phenylacetate-CoA ligase